MKDAQPPSLIASARGQVTEFAVWGELLRRAAGTSQLFLPLNDRGVDGMLHRRDTGRFIPIQVKGRSRVHNGEIDLAIEPHELRDAAVQIVLIRTDETGTPLNDAFIFDVDTFLRHSAPASDGSGTVRRAYIPLHPRATSPWHAHAVPFDEIAQRILTSQPSRRSAAIPAPADEDISRRLRTGLRGEIEFIRRTADVESLNLFHAAPDTELAEYAVYDVESRNTIGIQVKCGSPSAGRDDTMVTFPVHTFFAAPNVFAVVLAQRAGSIEIEPECLLIPSADIPVIASLTDSHYHLRFRPGPGAPTVVDAYRLPLPEMAARLHEILRNPST